MLLIPSSGFDLHLCGLIAARRSFGFWSGICHRIGLIMPTHFFCDRSPAYNQCRLQRVQNSLSRVVLPKFSHLPASELLLKLHWLPIDKRVEYKLASLTFKTLSVGQPVYLRSLLHDYQPTRSLRSSSRHLLSVPSVSSEFGRRSFSFAAPDLWNRLPIDLRCSSSLDSFKRQLKTHLFTHSAV